MKTLISRTFSLFGFYSILFLTCMLATGCGGGSQPSPTITLSSIPTSVQIGQSSTLNWTSTNATSCTASGAWEGMQSTKGNATVTPTATGTNIYNLTCIGLGGTSSASATVDTTVPPAPTVTIGFDNSSIQLGQTAKLTWASTNVMSCIASGAWSGTQPVSGSFNVTPIAAGNQLFTLVCTGAGGSGTNSATLATTVPPLPTVTLALDNSSIQLGKTAKLTWSSTNALSCFASGAWGGNEAISGSLTVTPTAAGSNTYTLSCTGPGGSTTNSTELTATAALAHFTPGTTTVLATATLGATGGTLSAPANSTLDGMSVVFPAGALSTTRTVTLGSDSGTLATVDGIPSGKAIVLNFGGSVQFAQPVHITFHFTGSAVPVPYFVDTSGNLHVAQLSALDSTNQTATFDTFHASTFTWILADIGLTDSYSTAFTAGHDDFQVVNYGSDFGRVGECFGMSSFALWYFENGKASDGDFYPQFMNSLGTDSSGRTRVGQNVIATRAFTSIIQQWNTYVGSVIGPEIGLSPAQNYTIIRDALLNTANPVLIYLSQSAGHSAHSVLATGFDQGKLSLYDVNFPGTVHTIVYDTTTGAFQPYLSAENATASGTSYDGIYYNGDGSLYLTEPYSNILAQAKEDFASSLNASVIVTSPTNGQTVTSRVLHMTGSIVSSQVLVDKLKVFVGSTEFDTNVAADGTFNITLTIDQGTNHVLFTTQGMEDDGTGNNIFVDKDVPNNLANTDFTIIGNVPTSVIYTTLTWDTNNTDLDTYVIDPTGDYSAYYHKETADGGFLDYDITTGYGPEHWLLTTANTVRWGEDYKMRVHYYSDHGNGPSNYTVTIQLYDGTQAITTYYRGNLAISNPSNDSPTGTGPDWADIATITPVQQVAGQTQRAPEITPAVSGQPIHITVYVPPVADRIKMKPQE